MDTESKKDRLMSSIGSDSKEEVEERTNIRDKREFSSEKKNSTIKEASASNMEETIGVVGEI